MRNCEACDGVASRNFCHERFDLMQPGKGKYSLRSIALKIEHLRLYLPFFVAQGRFVFSKNE